MRAGGGTFEEAKGAYEVYLVENDPAHEPGKYPTASRTLTVRLCPDCAAKAKLSVGLLDAGVPCYSEPPEFRD